MAVSNNTFLIESPQRVAPVSPPSMSVARVGPPTPPMAAVPPFRGSFLEKSSLLEDLASYIAVGVLKRLALVSVNDKAPSVEFPSSEVANLERHNWIRTTVHSYRDNPQSHYVRVYVLPDDVGRKLIPRSSTTLRRALKVVMAKIDSSPDAWNGDPPSYRENIPVPTSSIDDESLWYIFNTLQNPDPKLETIENPYAKQAMQDIFCTTPMDGEEDAGLSYSGVWGLKTPLYPYQRRSAATMIQREVRPAQMLDPRLQPCTSPIGQAYYYDKEQGSIVKEKKMYSEACGGILAETMGCGKTLICLAVILATRGHFPQIPLQFMSTENPVRKQTGSLVEMAASVAGRFSLPWKAHFDRLRQMGEFYDGCVNACEAHRGAYTIPPAKGGRAGRRNVEYPRLTPQSLPLCSGTLIISPPNLVDHWKSEIEKHTEGLKVLILRTSSDTTPSPDAILYYDIILFSKTRFEKEAEDSGRNGAVANRKDSSPLTKVHWLRIIVDEGHNVAGHGGSRTNVMHLLDQMHVERRWVVSGTPSTGLYGVEVSLASQETHTSDTDMTEATTAVLRGRKKTGNAADSELKDLDKLRLIVVHFLDLKPWSNSSSNDPANWSKYIKPLGKDGKRRKAPSLRATLQGLVVRHRLDVIHNEIPLPRLHNKVVYLEPTFHDKLSLNIFIFILAVNAITSEMEGKDYMFHPSNRKALGQTISNLRQAGFWWTSSEDKDTESALPKAIETAMKYIENNRERMTEDDVVTLTQGVSIAQIALASGSWDGFKKMHELGVFVKDFPPEARSFWALDRSQSHREPLLLGISQAQKAQQFVTAHLGACDPAEGLAGAGIKVRNDLAGRESLSNSNSSTSTPVKAAPESPIKRQSLKETFAMGRYKELSPNSPLMKTRLVGTTSAKLTYLLDRVQELHQKEKIIIFYDSNNSAFWIAEGLELLGIAFRIYASTLKPALREEYLTLFRESEEVRVLLMDLRQASHGLHVAHASRVFIVNPIWQPNVESQAIKRAHRIGQTRPVFVETLVLRGTLEDKMLQRRKAMSDTEIHNDLLDDSTMSSIIQHERFIPMSDHEDLSPLALLENPIGFFDRHRLPIPDSHTEPSPYSMNGSTSKPLEKRKRVAIAPLDEAFDEEVNSEPDIFTPKRRKSPPRLQFRDANGIIMTSPNRRSLSPFVTSGLAG